MRKQRTWFTLDRFESERVDKLPSGLGALMLEKYSGPCEKITSEVDPVAFPGGTESAAARLTVNSCGLTDVFEAECSCPRSLV
jgi:hypothetical protein